MEALIVNQEDLPFLHNYILSTESRQGRWKRDYHQVHLWAALSSALPTPTVIVNLGQGKKLLEKRRALEIHLIPPQRDLKAILQVWNTDFWQIPSLIGRGKILFAAALDTLELYSLTMSILVKLGQSITLNSTIAAPSFRHVKPWHSSKFRVLKDKELFFMSSLIIESPVKKEGKDSSLILILLSRM